MRQFLRRFAPRLQRWIIRGIRKTRNARISFEFEPAKLVAATTLFAQAKLPDLTTLKIAKLLYFADKLHLLKYGRPIIGDAYFGMKDGPVPSRAYDVLKGATGKAPSAAWKSVEQLFNRFLEVVTAEENRPAEFRAKRSADLDELSRSDREALEEVIATLGRKSPSELRALAHNEPDFALIENEIGPRRKRVAMPYETFFEGQPDSVRAIKSLALAEQEDRDFFARL
jgi:uncharacterized phage-associated protein